MKKILVLAVTVILAMSLAACKKSREDLSGMCDKGDAKACHQLGGLEEKADNVAAAKDAYRKACENANPEGCLAIAVLEEKAGNFDRARDYYNKACDAKVNDACKSLERLAQKGK